MQVRYEKHWSGHLNRDMEFKVYGHGGMPVLFIMPGSMFGRRIPAGSTGQSILMAEAGNIWIRLLHLLPIKVRKLWNISETAKTIRKSICTNLCHCNLGVRNENTEIIQFGSSGHLS